MISVHPSQYVILSGLVMALFLARVFFTVSVSFVHADVKPRKRWQTLLYSFYTCSLHVHKICMKEIVSKNNVIHKRLLRPRKGRWVGGVALGLANYFNLPVPFIRLIWILLLLPGGLPGLLPYILLWTLLPSEK